MPRTVRVLWSGLGADRILRVMKGRTRKPTAPAQFPDAAHYSMEVSLHHIGGINPQK